MSILISGAGGYVGQELAAALLSSTPASTKITLVDIVEPPVPEAVAQHASRVTSVRADLTSTKEVDDLISASRSYDTVYLLHGIMSSGAEANFELGIRVNLDSTRYVLDRLRETTPGVKVILTSSLAIYGLAPPGLLADETNFTPVPTTSYGSQKLISEILVNDYSRKGFIDGRCVRLPTVTVRAGKPTQAASSFASDIIREPFHGKKAVLPVGRDTHMWICSPKIIIKNIIHASTVPKEAWGVSRSVNLPGLKVSVQEMLDALEAVGGKERRGLVEEKYDPVVDKIVQGWTPEFSTERAFKLGFSPDISIEENIKHFASAFV